MSRTINPVNVVLASALALLLVACSTGPTYNPTTFAYEMDRERLQANNVRTVVIPHVNLGGVSRNYLDKEAPRIDGYVSTYLKENGFKVLPQRRFTQHWNTAVRAYGNPVDPTTGRVNMKTFAQIMQSVRDEMSKSSKLDAFVFTDIIEVQVAFNGGLKHLARWDGVSRKPSLQGPGEGVTAGFDWNMQVSAASIQISVFDIELKRLFASRGGMEATEAIDTRSSEGRYVRRRNILENKDQVMEGIQIALHPFVEYDMWPGQVPE